VPEINWNLLQPVDIGANFQTGFAMGQQLVQKAKLKSALAAYSQDPTNPAAVNALAAASPEFAYKMASTRAELAAKAQEKAVERARIGGILKQYDTDPNAARRAALESGDPDLAKQIGELNEDQRKRAAEMYKGAAPIAYRIRQTADPAQRKAIFDQARPILEAQGWPADKLDSFDVTDDTALDAVITSAQTVNQLIDQGKITWHQQGEQPSFATDAMGHPIGTQNPARVAQPAATGGFDAAVEHVLTNEGGYNASDMNGKPVNFGINQGANPDIDVKNMTRDQARQVYHDRYWVPSGAEDLPSNLQAPYFDVYIRNPSVAKRALSQSGGDPVKFMEITNGYFRHLGQTPEGQRYAKAWANRDSRNLSIATGAPHITSKADFDALPSGAEFIAPDGTHRRKP